MQRWWIAGLLAACAVGTGTAASATFPDPVGDVRGGAGPDLASLTVSHTRTAITFRFRFATPTFGAATDMLLVGLDVPPRTLVRSAQGWRGLDYYFGTHGRERSAMLVRAGSSGRGTVLGRPRVTRAGRDIVVSIARRAIGDPVRIELVVAVGREAKGGGSDEAPARGAFHYRLLP